MISVIIPVFNAQNTIRRCLDSILHQTYSDYEAIVIDDGSTDESPAICDEYATKDRHFHIFHKPNGGVSSARNTGLLNARGEWITFADSDDMFTEDAFTIIADTVGKIECKIEHKLILENAYIVRESSKQKEIVFKSPVHSFYQLFDTPSYGALWNKTFSADIIRRHNMRFDESLHYCEDCLFVAEYCSYLNAILYVEERCYIQFCPDSYHNKYLKYWNFPSFLNIYCKTKIVNPSCASARVDGLTMLLLKELLQSPYKRAQKDIGKFRDSVGKDIINAKGKKKFAIRWLSHFKNIHIWSAVLYIYAKLRLAN